MEDEYPGIRDTIVRLEGKDTPACGHCTSADTAKVLVGFTGRTFQLAAATTKAYLIPNGPAPGNFRCNACGEYFN